ncbi:MAG: hypothetical protein J6V40_05720 [Clostridia bacterium]|nr:hypothetical protein [Clostridia bacterium]
MKLDYSTTETRAIDAYNAALIALEKSAKNAEDSEYNRLRQGIKDPYSSDYPTKGFVRETIDEMVFESKRKKARKEAHKKYDEVMSSLDPKQTMIRDKAYSSIKGELFTYGYSMAYLNRLPEKIVLDLYRAYLLDKETGFEMPIEMKLEGHMNAILSNVDVVVDADNFFEKASSYTVLGRTNAYYAPARHDVDKHFVNHKDEPYRYAVACRQARFDFFESIDHRKMAEHTPVTQSGTYKQNLARLVDSKVYDHNNVERKGKNPYARLLSMQEFDLKARYADIATTKRVDAIPSTKCASLGEFYKAYIMYRKAPSTDTLRAVISRIDSARKLAEAKVLRCSEMYDCMREISKVTSM